MPNQTLQQLLTRFIQTGWHQLTTPADTIQDSHQRQQAQIFSTMMLIWVTTSGIFVVAHLLTSNIWSQVSAFVPLSITAIMLLLYGISRTRYYRLAILGFICFTYSLLFAIHLAQHIPPDRILSFLVLIIFVVSILGSARTGAMLSAVHLVLLIVLALSSGNAAHYFPVFILNLLVSALIVLMACIRQMDTTRLAESETRYRNLMRANFEAVVVCDQTTKAILDVNQAFEEIMGYARDDVLGQQLDRYDIHPGKPRQQRTTYIPAEIVAFHKNGAPLNLEVVSYSQQWNGQTVQVSVLRDITARKRANDQHVELAIQKERVKMLNDFIDDTSHHFRTPITSMKTSLYLIEKLQHKPERREQHIQVMKMQMERMEHLLDNLLMMSRLEKEETGDFSYVGQFDLNGLLKELTASHPLWQQGSSTKHQMQLAEDLPLIFGDKGQLGNALRHLLDNALLYIQDDGTIKVHTYTDVNLMQVYIEIQDDGIGIAEVDIPHIFRNFYRSDSARDKAPEHIGLGLGIAKKIIDRHRGAIHVESDDEQGTTFRVVLPTINALPGAVRRIANEGED